MIPAADAPPLILPPKPAIIRPAEHKLMRPGFLPANRADRRAALAELLHRGEITEAQARKALVFFAPIGWASATGGPDVNTIFLLHFDGADGATTFTDEVGAITWAAVGAAQLDTAIKKYGTGALMLETPGDGVTATHASLARGTGAFTFECDVNFSSVSGVEGIFGPTTLVNTAFSIRRNSTTFDIFITAGGEYMQTGALASTSTWIHICLERTAAGAATFYTDGVVRTTNANWNTNLTHTTYGFGRDRNGFNAANMNIDNGRLSNVIRYGGAFTPPAGPH